MVTLKKYSEPSSMIVRTPHRSECAPSLYGLEQQCFISVPDAPLFSVTTAHEKEIEEKQKEIEEFEKVTADVECRKEKVQRQLQLNRDNIERCICTG